jgi:hypothetical protein
MADKRLISKAKAITAIFLSLATLSLFINRVGDRIEVDGNTVTSSI